MKKIPLPLLLLSINLIGQVQVSDVEKLEYSYETPIPVTYNDSTYLILRRKEKTNIYGIDSKGIQFNHSIRSRPFSTRQSSYSIIDQDFVEYYESGLLRSNFLTGEVLDTVNFGNELRYTNRGAKIEDRYMVTYLWDASFKFYVHIYDLELKESQLINVEESGVISNNKNLFFIDKNKEVYHYDLENKQKELLYIYENEISSFGNFGNNIFISDTTKSVNIFDDSGIIDIVDCFDEDDYISRLGLVNEFIFAKISIPGSTMGDSLKCFDPETCELKYATGNFRVGQSSDYPENTVLLFSNSINYQRYKWLNFGTFEATEWDEVANYSVGYGFNINEELYFTGHNTYEGYYNSKCFIYDSETNSTEELSIGNGEDYTDIRMTFDGDKTLHFITILDDMNYQLWHYNTVDKLFSQSDVSDLQRDIGVGRFLYSPKLINNDKLFFITNAKLYLTKEDETLEVLDDLFTSSITEQDGKINVISLRSDSLFSVIISEKNVSEFSFISSEIVESVFPYHFTNNVHFFGNNRHYNTDLKIIDSIPLAPHNGEVSILNTNGNIALGRLYEDFNYTYFTFNTKNRELVIIPFLAGRRFHSYPVFDSQFLMVEWSNFSSESKVFLIDSLGDKNFEKSLNYSLPYNRIIVNASEESLIVPLQENDSTVFYMVKNDKVTTHKVRNNGIDYQKEPFIFMDNNEVILQTNNSGSKIIEYVSFENEPVVLDQLDQNLSLRKAYITSDKIIIMIVEIDSGSLLLRKYDKFSLSLEDSGEMISDVSRIEVGSSFNRLSDTSVLLVINDTYHGNELYNLNLNSLELILVKDLYIGSIGSDPVFITKRDNDIYFTANASDYSRQLFKYNASGDTVMIVMNTSENKLIVYPNPGYEQISLNEPLKSYLIFDRNGNVVMKNNADGISIIYVNELSKGNYFIMGVNLNGETVTTQFVKM
ncbi:MAG: hypothetical protein ACJATI_002969 [Halioglobus sp.]|jgi:hypothetical protein